jgi:hypothetical protein
MPTLYLREAIDLLVKTSPFLWLRLGSYLVLGLGLGVYGLVVGALAWLLGSLWQPLGWVVVVVAFGGVIAVVRWATRYYFYLLKAAHTAVMTEVIVRGEVPANQVAHGRRAVQERFRDTSVLFLVDQLVDGVVKRLVGTLTRIAGVVPLPGLQGIGGLLERVAVASTTFVDESILSRAYARREQNVWNVVRDGLVLYAQAWRPILATAVVLAALGYVWFFLFAVVFALPAAAIGAVLPGLRLALAIGVLIAAWMSKLALADAYALAATLLAYHRATAGLAPDPAWVAKIEHVSDAFKEIGRRAQEAVAPAAPDVPTVAPAADAPAGTAAPGAAAPGAAPATAAVADRPWGRPERT